MGSLDGLHDFEVNDTSDHVAWLVEGALSLQLDLSLGELTPFVGEEKHTLLFNYKIVE